MTRKYSTLDEAIFRIDAIAEKVLGDFNEGFACKVTVDEFWKIVEENAR